MSKHNNNNIDPDITIDFNRIPFSFNENEVQEMKENIDITELLSNRYNIVLDSNNKALCPFHSENTPSFSVHKNNKTFRCFSCGENGTIFDLVMKLEKVSFIQAKDILRSFYSNPSNYTLNYNFEANKKIVKKSTKKPSNATRTIIAIQSIQSKEVINYVRSRGISKHKGLQEIIYRDNNNILRKGLTWSNNADGHEIGYYKFKSIEGSKDITYIKAKKDTDTLLVFEGYFDYLSYREINYKKSKEVDTCILNSVTLQQRLIDYLPNCINNIGLALDNDKAGDRATKVIQDHYSDTDIKVTDHRHTYRKYSDLNDRLLKKKMSKEVYTKRLEA